MHNKHHTKLRTKLLTGFGITALLAAILGGFALIQMNKLASLNKDIYDHPLAVSNAVRDIQINIANMHRSMKDVVLADDKQQLQAAIDKVNEQENNALASFEIIAKQFLGDKEDIQTARVAFLQWKPIRQQVIDLVNAGKIDQAENITKNQGAKHIDTLNESIEVLSSFANAKAKEFHQYTQIARQRNLLFMIIFITVIVAMCLACGIYITKSITQPIYHVIEQINIVAKGDLNHKINMDPSDEIGQLAYSFDQMTNDLKLIIANRDELDAANQQLTASEQQLKANEQQLRAFNQQLRASEQQLKASNQQLIASEQQLQITNELLQASERKHRGLLDNLSVGVVAHGPDTSIIFNNPMASEILGLSESQMVGKTAIDPAWKFLNEDGTEMAAENYPIQLALNKQENLRDYIAGISRPDKQQITWVTCSSFAVYYEDGSLEYILISFVDITARITLQKHNQQLLQDLQGRNEELKSIAYISSHDLKTPLINIKGFSDLLIEHCTDMQNLIKNENVQNSEIDTLITKDIPEDLNYICSSTARMDKLICGMQKVSHIGVSEIDIQPIEMNHVLAGIINIMKYQTDSNNTEIKIDTLPGCMGDESQITQVFTNLIDNALKYKHPDRNAIISITGKIENKRSLYCIEDNGIGIHPDHYSKIFEIYHRLDPRQNISGQGLGLTIIKRILDRNNGKIWLESEPNQGSKFFVYLPMES
ncbi:MAG: MCP four helix bundle domain-containing protein [Phycisphaerae bacterium]|nr:MCP four helix bundle domain-containing protein [Phycisphaerae bacterium]